MLINTVLIIALMLFLGYGIYDQIIMDKWRGKTLLAIPLKRQAIADNLIFIALIMGSIFYGLQQNAISSLTLFLLSACILMSAYGALIRRPRLLLKRQGFFFGNIFFHYQSIVSVNLADNTVKNQYTKRPYTERLVVIDLCSGRRLLVRIADKQDIDKLVRFFGGYKVGSKK